MAPCPLRVQSSQNSGSLDFYQREKNTDTPLTFKYRLQHSLKLIPTLNNGDVLV